MKHDFTKPTYVQSLADVQKKRRLPIYMLILAGLFLLALIIYMATDVPL